MARADRGSVWIVDRRIVAKVGPGRVPNVPTARFDSRTVFFRIPSLITLRPGDANEVVEAYRYILGLRHQPAVLALSRQPLPTLDRSKYAPATGVARGA